jgi:glutamate-1-semialdehyde 2,1-aminomutase
MRLASKEFLGFLREAANILGAVLIFDEVVTSRLDYHGLQGKFSITPDMTTLGKYIGGGMPFGAFGGKREIMGLFDPRSSGAKKLSHSGTFNNNIFTMSAAVAASKIVTKEAIERTNRLGENARSGMNGVLQKAGKADKVTAVGCGSCVGINFSGPDAEVLREICYFHHILQGFWIGRRGFLAFNFAHTGMDVDTFLDCFMSFVDTYLSDSQ